jgi:hypothetical protein
VVLAFIAKVRSTADRIRYAKHLHVVGIALSNYQVCYGHYPMGPAGSACERGAGLLIGSPDGSERETHDRGRMEQFRRAAGHAGLATTQRPSQ